MLSQRTLFPSLSHFQFIWRIHQRKLLQYIRFTNGGMWWKNRYFHTSCLLSKDLLIGELDKWNKWMSHPRYLCQVVMLQKQLWLLWIRLPVIINQSVFKTYCLQRHEFHFGVACNRWTSFISHFVICDMGQGFPYQNDRKDSRTLMHHIKWCHVLPLLPSKCPQAGHKGTSLFNCCLQAIGTGSMSWDWVDKATFTKQGLGTCVPPDTELQLLNIDISHHPCSLTMLAESDRSPTVSGEP